MKTFDELTHEELATLNDADLAWHVNRACAEQGIPLFLEAEESQTNTTVAADMPVYKVNVNAMFADKADAVELAKWLNSKPRLRDSYDYRHNYQKYTVEPDDSMVEISEAAYYRPETFHKFQAEIQLHKEKEEARKQLRERNARASESRSAVYREMWKKVRDARDKMEEVARLDGKFVQYCQLANGDKEMARKFLIRAEKLDESWQPSPGVVA